MLVTGRHALTVGRSFSRCRHTYQGLIRLGQVETHELLPDDQMQAAGRVLGAVDGKGLGNADVPLFGSVAVTEAEAAMITRLNEGTEATLEIGVMNSYRDDDPSTQTVDPGRRP